MRKKLILQELRWTSDLRSLLYIILKSIIAKIVKEHTLANNLLRCKSDHHRALSVVLRGHRLLCDEQDIMGGTCLT